MASTGPSEGKPGGKGLALYGDDACSIRPRAASLIQNETATMELSPSETAPRSVAASSPGLDASLVRAVVVVPTFRRPAMLAETLSSLIAQQTSVSFAVIVVENDATGRQGVAVAKPILEAGHLKGLCTVETAQGNVHAINAGFTRALELFPQADHLLMIDDDEIASPQWLALMVEAAEREDADVVGGPVVPRFRDDAPAVLARHPVFWPSHEATGPVAMIYGTGNCLIRRRVFAQLGRPPLDPRFNFLGGGDMDFFTRCRRAGLSSYWVQEAMITETVSADRARIGWVLKRGLRIGSINRAVELKNAGGRAGRLKVLAKDLAIVPLALMRASLTLLRTGNPMMASHPLAVSAGRLAAAWGIEQQPYRAPANGAKDSS
jgi:glycosyltransferase involved in cell wall biosynthesis